MSSTETESTNPEHAPSSGVVDPKNAPDEDNLLNRLGEQTEFNNPREDLQTLHKAFSSHANSNGMLDFVSFQKGLREVCPDLNGELLYFIMSEEECSNLLHIDQVIVFLSKVMHMTFTQRIKLMFQLVVKNKDEKSIVTKKELVQFFHKVAPLLHELEDNDPLYSTPLLSPTMSLRALSAAMKDDAIPSPSSSFPQPSSSGSPLVNIHAQKNPSVGRLTGTSSAANQLVLNAMTHTLTLDQIQTLIDECFGFSALNPDKTTLTYQEFQSWFMEQKRVAVMHRAEELARREQQQLQLEIKVSLKVQELIDCNKFTEEEVKCIRNIFNQFDNDRTGEINTKKILSVFPDVSEEAMQEFMAELDPKSLGYITFDRFLETLGPFFIQESEAAYEAEEAGASSKAVLPTTVGTNSCTQEQSSSTPTSTTATPTMTPTTSSNSLPVATPLAPTSSASS